MSDDQSAPVGEFERERVPDSALLGFKSFDAAQKTLAGIELVNMIKKGQMRATREDRLTPAEQFYALAA